MIKDIDIIKEAFDSSTVDTSLWDEIDQKDPGERINVSMTVADLRTIRDIIRPARTKLTDEQYVIHNGNLCPNCRSRNINAFPPETQDFGIDVRTECECCGATWTETYSLIGYDNLEIPSKKK